MDVRPLDRETYAGRRFTTCCRTRGRRGIRSCAGGARMDYAPFWTPAERSFDDTFFGERPARQEGRGFASPLLPFSDAASPAFFGCPVDIFGKHGIVS